MSITAYRQQGNCRSAQPLGVGRNSVRSLCFSRTLDVPLCLVCPMPSFRLMATLCIQFYLYKPDDDPLHFLGGLPIVLTLLHPFVLVR